MKLTLEISKHPHGIAVYIHQGTSPVLQVLAEPAATADQIARLVGETIEPLIEKEIAPEPKCFLFTGEYGKAVYKSYKAEDETDMADKIITATMSTGPIVKIVEVDPGIALLLGLHYPVVDGIDGLIA
jgi:hypothetical protein